MPNSMPHYSGCCTGEELGWRGRAVPAATWGDPAVRLGQFVCPSNLWIFCNSSLTTKLAVFLLLAKTHKQGFGLSSSGRFLSHPVVGMHRWATTPSSIFLATSGTILLKVDRALHPLSEPLRWIRLAG